MKAVFEMARLHRRSSITSDRSPASDAATQQASEDESQPSSLARQPALAPLPSASPSIQAGERRRLMLVVAMLFALIYVPRIPRLETYLLVSSKRAISLAPTDQNWRRNVEASLASLEQAIKVPSQDVQQLSDQLTGRLNRYIETINCPTHLIETYAQKRLTHSTPFNQELERRCQGPVDRVLNRERDLFGLTADGHIRLRPSDKVLLAGDSLMQGPATQIAARLRSHGVRPIDASRVSTGLAYPQFFNWPERIKTAIEKEKVDVVIVFLGANDTFDMYDGPRVIKLGTPQWTQLYTQRIESIASMAQSHKVALLWLGMPAMNRRDIQPHVPSMNRMFATTVQRHGGLFLPTAEVVGNSETLFSPTKEDGKHSVLTRSEDGVHFTPTGWSMLADAAMNRISLQ